MGLILFISLLKYFLLLFFLLPGKSQESSEDEEDDWGPEYDEYVANFMKMLKRKSKSFQPNLDQLHFSCALQCCKLFSASSL